MAIATASNQSLAEIGVTNLGAVHWNLSVPQLVEQAIARSEAVLASNGALVAATGSRTGRSPKDKFIVRTPENASRIAWGKINQPIEPAVFNRFRARVSAYLQGRDVFVLDAWVGADPAYRLPIRVVAEYAWHELFARQLFRRMTPEEQANNKPAFTVIAAPEFLAVPATDDTRSETAILVNFEQGLIIISGTKYAGEIKKSIFGVMNYVLPLQNIFPMHCSANLGAAGDVALFFGLSGTGKTTLSTDPERPMIGDDEHGWSDKGVFNFEGGCYAKCINLSQKHEPQIWNAVRFGSVVENVVVDPVTRVPDYTDDSLTENTRAAYPLDFIENAVPEGMGGHPSAILLLSADAFGVLPPLSILTPEQATYYFLSGYTAKLAGTEAGMGSDPEPDFSLCFGAPFFPLPATVYSKMFRKKIEEHQVRVYLVNTGWSGGPYGVGARISLPYTRAMVRAAISGALEKAETWTDPIFGLHVPTACPDVPASILRPRDTWKDSAAYDRQARDLARSFVENCAKFPDADPDVRAAGPRGS
ncbi:MAG TPA: phosphoenolpyruvate carboxykinase (ATP) [Ktedonobacterales bacterium]|jgi:phosphoenolpyruvate carboxykinase (ATP)